MSRNTISRFLNRKHHRANSKLKILIISHAPAVKIRTRSRELAHVLCQRGHSVDVFKILLQDKDISKVEKAIWHAKALTGLRRKKIAPGLYELHLPNWTRGGIPKKILSLLNRWLIDSMGYDLVISADYGHLDMSSLQGPRLFYDLVDDHAYAIEEEGKFEEAEYITRFISRQIKNSDVLMVSSLVLKEKAEADFGMTAEYMPNGANLRAIRSCGGKIKYDIGYVGSMDRWVEVDRLVEACEHLRQKRPDLSLLLVGQFAEKKGFPEWVHATGFIAPEKIPQILHTFKVGVVPFEVSPFTDAALPLKVIEYGAARRPVVSTPLRELKEQKFPWVRLSDLEKELFADSLDQGLNLSWDPKWDQVVDQFSWQRTADRVIELYRQLP